MNLGKFQRKLLERTRRRRLAFFLTIDIGSIIVAVVLAFLLRFEGTIPSQYFQGGLQAAIVLVLISVVPVLLLSRLYSFTWAYVSLEDLLLLGRALALSALITGALFVLIQTRVSPMERRQKAGDRQGANAYCGCARRR